MNATTINYQDSALMAYQVAFNLSENQNQPFLLRIVSALPAPIPAVIKLDSLLKLSILKFRLEN